MPTFGGVSFGWESDQSAARIQGCEYRHGSLSQQILWFSSVCHYFLSRAAERLVIVEQPVHYPSRTGVTAVKGLPHSKQHAFNRDVINPQDGHILCDPTPAIRGFSLRIL